jgi:hypothetical protein
MMIINNIILLAAWITSFGLLGVVLVWYAQADAAQEKLANEWALSRRQVQRQRVRAWASGRAGHSMRH